MTVPRDGGAASARAALLCCLAAGFATLLDATVVAFTAPPVAATLGASTAGVQWFLASYSLTFGLGLVPAGRLGDAFGRRGLFVGGLLVFLLGGIASAAAPEVWILVAGRLLQGLGAGFISAQVLGIIQDTFRGTARVQALGAYSAVGAAAAIVGPLTAGLLLQVLPVEAGWRWVLLAPVPFTVAAIWLGIRALPRGRHVPHGAVTRGLDLPGIALLGAFVVLVTLPVIDPGLPLTTTVLIVSGAVMLAVALAAWERAYARRGRLPLFAPSLMRSSGFVTGNVVALLWFGSLMAFSTVTTVYFLQAYGIPAFAVALVLVPTSLARMVASRLSHRLYLRLGGSVVALGLALEVAGVLLILGAAFVWDGWALLIAIGALQILLGAAGGVIEPPLRAITLGFAAPELHGVAASFLQLTQRLSATFFVALATGVLLGAGGVIPPESLRLAIGISAAACVVALAVALRPSFRGAAGDGASGGGASDGGASGRQFLTGAPDISGALTENWRPRRGGGAAGHNARVLPGVSAEMTGGVAGDDTVGVSSSEAPSAAWHPIHVDWDDERASLLREAMDAELGARYADVFSAYDADTLARFERDFALDPATIVATVIVLDEGGEPVGHAALRALGDEMEVKRVFVDARARGTGVSRALMSELEYIGRERGAARLILQTGDRQPDAVTLYERIGYTRIPVFAPYSEFELSLCYEKPLCPEKPLSDVLA